MRDNALHTTGTTRPRDITYDKFLEDVVVVLCARSLDLHKQTALQAQTPSTTTERTATVSHATDQRRVPRCRDCDP